MEEKPSASMRDNLVNVIREQSQIIMNSIEQGFRKSTTMAVISLVMTALGLLVAVGGIVIPLMKVGSRVESVEKSILASQFTITTPADGAIVDRIVVIRGKTPFPKMRHYLVVTPVEIGEDQIQDDLVKVSASGLWTGRATLGAAAVGAGKQFIIRAFATKSVETLTEVPKDAIFSESITVIRKK